MGTQILKGSKGVYKPINPEVFGSVTFTVTMDTCMEAEKLPVKFEGSVEGHETWIYMYQATFSNPKMRDY